MAITQTQIDKIVIKAGKVYLDYGEATEIELGVIRGGGEFSVTETVRDIEADGLQGKTAGLQVIDDINAMLKATVITASPEIMAMSLPSSSLVGSKITAGNTGLIPLSKYKKNATMFCETADGKFLKIVIKNPMNEKGFTLAAKKKAEGEIALELQAHHDATQDHTDLYTIEPVDVIGVTPVIKTALNADIVTFLALNPELYTSASYGPVYAAYLAAKAVNDSTDVNQSVIDAAHDAFALATATLDLV